MRLLVIGSSLVLAGALTGCAARSPAEVLRVAPHPACAPTALVEVPAAEPELRRFQFRRIVMGVEGRITLYAPSDSAAVAAAGAAFGRMAELDSLMSDYRPDSELSLLSTRAAGVWTPASGDLFRVLQRAQELSRLSDGAFDVTLGPLVGLWRAARRSGRLPSAAERREALSRVGWRRVQLQPETRSVRLTRAGMRLDLGGIAKGYAAEQAVATLAKLRVRRAMVEMGGDLVLGAAPPGQTGWRVRVEHAEAPHQWRQLSHRALSTSGDTEQFVEIGGRRYSHVVDPATGLGLQSRVAATVIATDGATADALSTLLTVAGPRRGRRILRAHFPCVDAYVRRVGG